MKHDDIEEELKHICLHNKELETQVKSKAHCLDKCQDKVKELIYENTALKL